MKQNSLLEISVSNGENLSLAVKTPDYNASQKHYCYRLDYAAHIVEGWAASRLTAFKENTK